MQNIDIGINWEAPVSADLPAGPDMQFLSEFAELEAAATETPEQQFGAVVIPAKAPEWQHVLELATSLSRQTLDLRVLLQILRALTHLHGLVGFSAGLDALNRLLKCRWEHVHPQLVVEEVEDPQVRFGVLSELAAADGLVGDMRQARVFDTPLGPFTIRDLERVAEQGNVEINGGNITSDQLGQIVRDLLTAANLQADALTLPGQLVQLLDQIRQTIQAHSAPEFTPDLAPLARPLERVSSLLQGMVPVEDPAQASEPAASAADALHMPGALNSRAAVIKAMDDICTYLERNEPNSPVPLLVRRARRFMSMNFLDIVKDISPDGVNQVAFVVGSEGEEGAS
jgi:type VI secretion system protein ImpA